MSTEEPLVSVAMVTLNHARYLPRVMASILGQTHKNLELIIINNGSTDNSDEIISGFTGDSRVKYIKQENNGLSLGLNQAVKEAKGSFVALASGDDEWQLEKLSLQLQAMQAKNAGVCFSEARLVDDENQPVADELARQFPFSYENLAPAQFYEKLFFKTNFNCCTSALIKRSLLSDEPFAPSLLQLQDYELWVRLIKSCNFHIMPAKLVDYRVRLDGQNLSLDKSNRARVLFELHYVYERFFDNVDADFFKEAFGSHFRKAETSCQLALEFEKAFLYLKMREPAIYSLGLEKLSALLSDEEGRSLALNDYGIKIVDLWQMSKAPVFVDSEVQESLVAGTELLELSQQLAQVRKELSSTRESLGLITSGRLWRLREKVLRLVGPMKKKSSDRT